MAHSQGRDSAYHLLLFLTSTIFCILGDNTSHAKTIIVGDSSGWKIPAALDFYEVWARSQTFQKGDILVFNYTAAAHNVLGVDEKSYRKCDASSPLKTFRSGHDQIPLTEGKHWYICGVPNHCTKGMNLAITVQNNAAAAAAGGAPASSPAPAPISGGPVQPPSAPQGGTNAPGGLGTTEPAPSSPSNGGGTNSAHQSVSPRNAVMVAGTLTVALMLLLS